MYGDVQALLENAEVQHRILESNPLLEALDGFKELKEGGRRLSAGEVRALLGAPGARGDDDDEDDVVVVVAIRSI